MIGRGLRDLVFRGCTVAGGFLGFSLALKDHRGPQRAPNICRTHAHAYVHAHVLEHAITQCIGSDLATAVLSWVLPVGLGLLIGAVVGCLFCLDDSQRTPTEKQPFHTRSLDPSSLLGQVPLVRLLCDAR